MQWIKAHLIIVICGALSFLSVAMIVLGFFLSDVTDVMAKDANLGTTLVRIEPVNERVVEYWEKLRDENQKKAEVCFAELAKLGSHEPLTQGVFPSASEGSYAPHQFQDDFDAARRELLTLLKAGSSPTQEEVELEKLRMEEAKTRRKAVESLGSGGQPQDVLRRTPFPAFPSPMASPSGEAKREVAMTPQEMAEEIPAVRLSLRRARSIHCYAASSAFGSYPAVTNRQLRPQPDQLWYAQVALWLQKDVVQALATLNSRIAETVQARDEQPWVGNLPVKHLVEVDVGCYMPPTGTSTVMQGAEPVDAAFTQRGSGGTVDVVRFWVDMVIEAKMLPAVIDQICTAGFYTPVLINYEQVPANRMFVGCIYGSEPVIHTRIEFEACFLKSKYEQWMPETVKTAIASGRACPDRGREGTPKPLLGGAGGPAAGWDPAGS